MKFDIIKYKKDCAFRLFNKTNDFLFQFPNDILIYKENTYKSAVYQSFSNTFNYQGIRNVLIGKTGDHCFTVKRVLVIQMK